MKFNKTNLFMICVFSTIVSNLFNFELGGATFVTLMIILGIVNCEKVGDIDE